MYSMKIESVRGRCVPLPGNDIDTDRIIPARFMKCVTFEGIGKYAFYDSRFDLDGRKKDHPLNSHRFEDGEILLVNKNFGCGSSREHAPAALKDYGIKAIIGESFAEIFAGNCVMLGMPAVTVDEPVILRLFKAAEEKPDEYLEIDLRDMVIHFGGIDPPCTMPEAYRQTLLKGTWDSTSLLMGNIDKINQVHTRLPY